MPPEIVKLLMTTRREAFLGLDEAELTIFFSDIAGFTTISETLSPRELVALLGFFSFSFSCFFLRFPSLLLSLADYHSSSKVNTSWRCQILSNAQAAWWTSTLEMR